MKINQGDEMYTDPEKTVTAFSERFCAYAEKEQSAIHVFDIPRCSHSFYLRATPAEEVFQVIVSLKTTSAGLDNIDPFKVKLVSGIISQLLSLIINKLFSAGVFPSCLKVGKIVPVFKKGDKTSVQNYRPICILPFFGKVIE